ncbi:hypothetical protein TRVL_07797 [Trypanosoma vivax]|nr:hypothetical protein TRVL_07797 [Trypanosoma vivax]
MGTKRFACYCNFPLQRPVSAATKHRRTPKLKAADESPAALKRARPLFSKAAFFSTFPPILRHNSCKIFVATHMVEHATVGSISQRWCNCWRRAGAVHKSNRLFVEMAPENASSKTHGRGLN